MQALCCMLVMRSLQSGCLLKLVCQHLDSNKVMPLGSLACKSLLWLSLPVSRTTPGSSCAILNIKHLKIGQIYSAMQAYIRLAVVGDETITKVTKMKPELRSSVTQPVCPGTRHDQESFVQLPRYYELRFNKVWLLKLKSQSPRNRGTTSQAWLV